MADQKQKANGACRKCLKGASAFLKTQIALLRVNGRSPKTSAAIGKLKDCIKILNETGSSVSDTVSGNAVTAVLSEGKPANAPAKALKPGAYVKNYFTWLSASGVGLPESTISDGLSLKWSVKNLDLWRPLFATKETLTEPYRGNHLPVHFRAICIILIPAGELQPGLVGIDIHLMELLRNRVERQQIRSGWEEPPAKLRTHVGKQRYGCGTAKRKNQAGTHSGKSAHRNLSIDTELRS